MTIGDQIRKIRHNDGDSSEDDKDVKAYRIVIAEKKAELERL